LGGGNESAADSLDVVGFADVESAGAPHAERDAATTARAGRKNERME
jgi:hypothetical protein